MAKMILKLPKAAVSMQEGKIVEWFVSDGVQVSVGQKLYALETEKTTMEVDSPFDGIVTLLAQINITYQVGHTIAEINT